MLVVRLRWCTQAGTLQLDPAEEAHHLQLQCKTPSARRCLCPGLVQPACILPPAPALHWVHLKTLRVATLSHSQSHLHSRSHSCLHYESHLAATGRPLTRSQRSCWRRRPSLVMRCAPSCPPTPPSQRKTSRQPGSRRRHARLLWLRSRVQSLATAHIPESIFLAV